MLDVNLLLIKSPHFDNDVYDISFVTFGNTGNFKLLFQRNVPKYSFEFNSSFSGIKSFFKTFSGVVFIIHKYHKY